MTSHLLVAILAVCGFMFLQDVFGTGLSISEPRGLRFFPGFFDGMGDFVGRYGAGVSAVAAVHYGLTSWQFFAITAACAVTSFFTSNAATGKESEILPMTRMEKFTLADLWQRTFHPKASKP